MNILDVAMRPSPVEWWFEFTDDGEHWWRNDEAPHAFDWQSRYFRVMYVVPKPHRWAGATWKSEVALMVGDD